MTLSIFIPCYDKNITLYSLFITTSKFFFWVFVCLMFVCEVCRYCRFIFSTGVVFKNIPDLLFCFQVWNKGHTVFPDFTHPNATSYWVEMMSDFHKKVPYDGAWIVSCSITYFLFISFMLIYMIFCDESNRTFLKWSKTCRSFRNQKSFTI